MPDYLIPDDIREFLLVRLNSIAELEALLLLWRNVNQNWDIQTLASRLYITESDVSRILQHLIEQELVKKGDGFYQYWKSSKELGMIVDSLAQLYTTHLVPITNLMHSKSSNRIQEFANAFILRKDK